MSIRPLSDALQKKAESELNEVPSRIREDIEHIKEWLAKQPHLKARTDNQWILGFLRGCKFSLEATKEKLDLFYTMRTLFPEFFSNRDPLLPEIQEVLKGSLFIPLPNTTEPNSPAIEIFRVKDSNPEKISILTGIKVLLMMIDISIMENDNFIIAGQQLLIDMQEIPYQYVGQLTPKIIHTFLMCIRAYPVRPQGFYAIYVPSILETAYSFAKHFLNEKIINRIYFYTESNIDKMYKTLPPSVLPIEYGGTELSIQQITVEWKEKIESYRDWFLEDAAYCSDESKRPGKPTTVTDVFGAEGSFRKLHLD